jgi:hypothetical protein
MEVLLPNEGGNGICVAEPGQHAIAAVWQVLHVVEGVLCHPVLLALSLALSPSRREQRFPLRPPRAELLTPLIRVFLPLPHTALPG